MKLKFQVYFFHISLTNTLLGDEVDDLFKEAAQENGYSSVFQKKSTNGGKKKGINWLVNSM
jgi:hypothetical protein